jgi:uncharacterized membrane protein YGL010W
MTQKLAHYFNEYTQYHQTKGNVMTHYIGIPLIMCALFGLFAFVTFGNPSLAGGLFQPDLGFVLLVLVFFWYLSVDWKISVPFFFVMLGLYFIGRSLSYQVLISFFVVGWIFQLIGHEKYEKRKPAFMDNFIHTLIGLLYICEKLCEKVDIKTIVLPR